MDNIYVKLIAVAGGGKRFYALVLVELGSISKSRGAEELYSVLLCKCEDLLCLGRIRREGLIYVKALAVFEGLLCIGEMLIGICGC